MTFDVPHVAPVVLTVPHPLCSGIVNGWQGLLLPERVLGAAGEVNAGRKDAMGSRYVALAFGTKDIFPDKALTIASDRFTLDSAAQLSSFLVHLGKDIKEERLRLELHMWTSRLQNAVDASKLAIRRRSVIPGIILLKLVGLSTGLKNTRYIKDTFRNAVALLSDTLGVRWVQEMVEQVHIPKQSKVSSWRFYVDVAYMICVRIVTARTAYFRCLQIDSSPQAGRDYLNCIVSMIKVSFLARLFALTVWLERNPLRAHVEDMTLLARHEAIQIEITAEVWIHHLPTTLVGMGSASVSAKLHAFAHALRCEAFNAGRLTKDAEEMFCFTPDFGYGEVLDQAKQAVAISPLLCASQT